MKILTKEEEHDHYMYVPTPQLLSSATLIELSETLKGGSVGGLGGLAVGVLGVWGASQRYPAFRQITLPLRAFLMTSSATFGGTCMALFQQREQEY
jgi:hypothetical protein